MLFSSSTFLFLFLPAVLAGFYLVRRFAGVGRARLFLVLASLFFYGYWNPWYVFLILGSISVNLLVARRMHRAAPDRRFLLLGILFNLALLGYFKYSLFIAGSVMALFTDTPLMWQLTLPLAISFFTFQQIAFLVDAYREPALVKNTPWDKYLLFVLFFPQLIAGPIVHHKALVPQLGEKTLGAVTPKHIELGVGIFFLGLFKKVVIADYLATLSAPVFERLARGVELGTVDAWLGILAYTFRLYFDFSAYSDMAYGLALLFGVILPVNFFSPYKAGNINETWQRWNITLGNFFGNYVFRPLGGRKRGHLVAMRNLVIIMLLSGLWHGAGWNYLLWGCMQGAAMALAYIWPFAMAAVGLSHWREQGWYSRYLAVALTFAFWVLSLVAFRVTNLEDMGRFYATLFSLTGADLVAYASELLANLAALRPALSGAAPFAVGPGLEAGFAVLLVGLLVFLAPNTLQFFGVTRLGRIGAAAVTPGKAALVGLVAAIAIAKMISSTANEFIYFAF